jgi:uncharacterized protein YdaU (DUF1376 family)
MALTGLLWWIDRWRKSSAYMDMTAAEQGVYRNLIDEAWLRRGLIPNNERLLAKASGDAECWPTVRATVLKHFTLTPQGWRHDTLDRVLAAYTHRAERQARYRAAHNSGHNGGRNTGHNASHNTVRDPDPDPDQELLNTPLPPFLTKGGKALTRKETDAAAKIRARLHGGCPHDPRCEAYDACVNRLAYERRQKAAAS